MLVSLCAAAVALACVAAASRRLVSSISPIGLDPRVVVEALGRDETLWLSGALRRELASSPRYAWEHALLAAFDERDRPTREALVNEQIMDLEVRIERWSRVPRVCASIGTSAGFLLGSIALVRGLDVQEADGAGPALRAALESALDALALGIAATSFCVAVHVRGSRASRERRAAVDALIDRLRFVSDSGRRGT